MFHTFLKEKMLLSYKINLKNKLTRNFIYHCQDLKNYSEHVILQSQNG